MVEKRHLRVIAVAPTGEAVPPRSHSAWFVLGILLVVALWLPLGVLGVGVSRGAMKLWASQSASFVGLGTAIAILPIILSFAAAAYIGGLTVVRFGVPRNVKHGAWIGGFAAVVVASLAAAGGGLRPWIVGVMAYMTLIFVGSVAGAWGGNRGRRLRNAANLTSPIQTEASPGCAHDKST